MCRLPVYCEQDVIVFIMSGHLQTIVKVNALVYVHVVIARSDNNSMKLFLSFDKIVRQNINQASSKSLNLMCSIA